MSYVQPSMFDGYEDKEFSDKTDDETWIDLRPGWRMVSSRTRNLGWHKVKHRTALGLVTWCGRYGFSVAPATEPDRIRPCQACLELDDG